MASRPMIAVSAAAAPRKALRSSFMRPSLSTAFLSEPLSLGQHVLHDILEGVSPDIGAVFLQPCQQLLMSGSFDVDAMATAHTVKHESGNTSLFHRSLHIRDHLVATGVLHRPTGHQERIDDHRVSNDRAH